VCIDLRRMVEGWVESVDIIWGELIFVCVCVIGR